MSYKGSITTQIRPLKFAFIIDYGDFTQLQRAINLSCTIWGGTFCPILPVHKRKSKNWGRKHDNASTVSVLKGYLEAFDPDIIVKIADAIPEEVQQSGTIIINENELWKQHNLQYLRSEYGIGIFEILNKVFEEFFRFSAKYPVKIHLPQFDGKYAVFWNSVLGSYPKLAEDLIIRHFGAELEISEYKSDMEAMSLLFDNDALFPRRLTQQFLKQRRRSGFREHNYLLIVDATKFEDIIDYWNLRACGRNVIAVPMQCFQNDAVRKAAVHFLVENFKPLSGNSDVFSYTTVIPSLNVPQNAAENFISSLEAEKLVTIRGYNHVAAFQYWYPRIWDEWARDKDGIVCDDFYYQEKEMHIDHIENAEVYYDTFLPDFLDKKNYYSNAACANEINITMYSSSRYVAEVFPRASGRNYMQAIGSFTALRKQWRIGKNGMVRLVNYPRHERWDLPDAERIFFAWLKDMGYAPQLSVPGLIAKRLFEILEGYVNILADERLLKLLEYLNGGASDLIGKGRPVKGDPIIHQEREMDFGELRRRLKTAYDTDGLLEYLVEKKVFQVGLKVKCPHCFRDSWYAMDKLQTELSCKLCLNHFPATGTVEKGKWSYKTAGPFSIPQFGSGAYSVLLVLKQLNSSSLNFLKTTPVLSFTAKNSIKEELEADFAMFWEESKWGEKREGILFGEAKTFNEFKAKDFDRMTKLGRQFPGSVLVFATLRKKITAKELTQLKKIAVKGGKYFKHEMPLNPVLILTGNELLSQEEIPWCWQEQGINVNELNHQGLLEICQATQKIYLDLPSWQQNWTFPAKKSRPNSITVDKPQLDQ